MANQKPTHVDQWDDAGPFLYRNMPESCLDAFFTEERDIIQITPDKGGWWLSQERQIGQSRYVSLPEAKEAGDDIVDEAEAGLDARLLDEAGLSGGDWAVLYRDGLVFESVVLGTSIMADDAGMSGTQKWDLYVGEAPPVKGFARVADALAALKAD